MQHAIQNDLPSECGESIRNNRRTVWKEGSLALEPLEVRHAPAILEAVTVSRAELLKWLGHLHDVATLEEAHAYVAVRREKWDEATEYWFAVMDDGILTGICFLNSVHPLHHFANLGYWMRSDRTGRGYATAATRLTARFGFEQLGLHRIEILASIDNLGSQRVAEKAGALREGVQRNRLCGWREPSDAVMFSLIPSDL